MVRAVHTISILFAVALASACGGGAPDGFASTAADPAAADGARASNVTTGDDGRVYLSWVEPAGDETHRLRYSVWRDDRWSAPRTIATGRDWFVNWADFPSIAALADGTLAAHWLVRSAESSYAYDVVLALSTDGGQSWSDPFVVHDDGTPTEHGFVTLRPADADHFWVVWLDGRATTAGGHGAGAMTLRSARVGRDGRVDDRQLVDDRVCDCCQTDGVVVDDGTLVLVYRDRSDEEIRDVSYARAVDGKWSDGSTLARDGWKIAACPVNGPAIAAGGETLAAVWFSGADDRHRVRLAFSTDGGRTFGDAIRVGGDDVIGRVDVSSLDDGSAIVSWLEQSRVSLQRVDVGGGAGPVRVVARSGDERAAGFPRITRARDRLFVTWTEPGETTRVRAATVAVDAI